MRFFKHFINTVKNVIKIKKLNDSGNFIEIDKKYLGKLHLHIAGSGNKIVLKENSNLGRKAFINIGLCGDNNEIVIEEGYSLIGNLNITMGMNHKNFGKITNSTFHVGKNTSMGELDYLTYNSNASCEIGERCMFAYNITFFNTDAHPIFDYETKRLKNYVNGIKIGNHCWIGVQTNILKNVEIADDCIVGLGAVVSGNFLKEHSIIVGNPAKIVREGITWDSNGRIAGYIDNKKPN